MTDRSQSEEIPKLSEMEWEIMKPLWEHGPMAARDIYDRVADKSGWAYETVKTMLARLVRKGALAYDQVGNSFLYRPACSRSQVTREAAASFLERVCDGGLSLFLASFMEQASREEIAALKAELARFDREKPRRRGGKR